MLPAVPVPTAAKADPGWRVLAVLGLLTGFASISTDLFLPAMPTMAASLHSDAGTMALTVTSYLVGFSLGQLLWGPLGDRFGRRKPIAVGLVLFAIGSAGCALSQTGQAIIVWRVVQSIGACAGMVLARAMVRDLFDGSRVAQILSTLMTVMAIAPLVGPSLGGQILTYFGWRAIFWVLVLVGLVAFAALFTLPETLPSARRNLEPLHLAFRRYALLLRQRRLLAYAGAVGSFYAGTFAYVAGSPFAYISYHHVPPQYYGLLFGGAIVGVVIASQVNIRLVGRFGSDRMLLVGSIVAAGSGMAAVVFPGMGATSLAALAGPLLVFAATTGLVAANAVAGAMSGFPERAGAVSALVGALQYGAGVVGSAAVSVFADGTPWPMQWVVGLSGVGSLLCALSLQAGQSTSPKTGTTT